MINRVIISGVLVDEELTLLKDRNKPNFSMVEAKLLTNNGKKDEIREVKIVLFNKLAQDLYDNQRKYKENLCMYYGEVVYNSNKNETKITPIKKDKIIIKVGSNKETNLCIRYYFLS